MATKKPPRKPLAGSASEEVRWDIEIDGETTQVEASSYPGGRSVYLRLPYQDTGHGYSLDQFRSLMRSLNQAAVVCATLPDYGEDE